MSQQSGQENCGQEPKRSSFPERGDNFRTLSPTEAADFSQSLPALLADLKEKGWG